MTAAQQHGRALHARLVGSLQTDQDSGCTLSAEQLTTLIADWRLVSPRLDRNSCKGTQRACAVSPSACVGRCSWNYWEDHGRLTAVLMRSAAGFAGDDPHLYEQVGRLHDLDYLLHPHDANHRAAATARHPVPLVGALAELGFSTFGQIAILEHAPYLGLDRCRAAVCAPLSLSLSICEDAATLLSISDRSRFPLPSEVSSLLGPLATANVLIDCSVDRGRFEDMPERILENYRTLQRVLGRPCT